MHPDVEDTNTGYFKRFRNLFTTGNDFVFKTSLQRVDTFVEGKVHMVSCHVTIRPLAKGPFTRGTFSLGGCTEDFDWINCVPRPHLSWSGRLRSLLF
jgi:hypothetical protein